MLIHNILKYENLYPTKIDNINICCVMYLFQLFSYIKHNENHGKIYKKTWKMQKKKRYELAFEISYIKYKENHGKM